MRETIPQNMADWQKTTRTETQRFKLIVIGLGARNSRPTQNTGHNRPKTQDPNAMDVNATTSFPFKKLLDEECKQYMKEGRCFRCHQQGHMAKGCTRSPPPKPQTQARATVLRPGTVLLIFLYFTPCLTFSLRLMVTHRLDSCDHLLYRLVTWYVLVSLLLS